MTSTASNRTNAKNPYFWWSIPHWETRIGHFVAGNIMLSTIWYEAIEAIKATEVIEAVDVIEAAGVPDGSEIIQ